MCRTEKPKSRAKSRQGQREVEDQGELSQSSSSSSRLLKPPSPDEPSSPIPPPSSDKKGLLNSLSLSAIQEQLSGLFFSPGQTWKCNVCNTDNQAVFTSCDWCGHPKGASPPKDPYPLSDSLYHLPGSDHDLAKYATMPSLSEPEKIALPLSYRSLQLGRSLDKAYMVVFGLTGVGKSATINKFFNKDICPSGSGKSVTAEAIEYSVEFPDQNNQVRLSLRVVDTPGLCDTDGEETESRNIHAIQQFQQFFLMSIHMSRSR